MPSILGGVAAVAALSVNVRSGVAPCARHVEVTPRHIGITAARKQKVNERISDAAFFHANQVVDTQMPGRAAAFALRPSGRHIDFFEPDQFLRRWMIA